MHPLRRDFVVKVDCLLYRFNIFMQFSQFVKFPTFRNCPCNRFFRYFFCFGNGIFHFHPFLLQITFHTRKIGFECACLSLCDRVDVHPDTANLKTIFMQCSKQGIFVLTALIFHYNVYV